MVKVGRFLDKLIAFLGYVGIAAGGASIIIMALAIGLNVILRHIFDLSLMFVEEYSGYLLGVVVYMSLAYTARTNGHVFVELVVQYLPKRKRQSLGLITTLIAIMLMGLYLWFAWDLFMESIRRNAKAMTVTQTPLWIPQVFLWVGLIFLILELVVQVVKKSMGLLGVPKKDDMGS